LDDDKRSTICSLVASGVSLRQAANYIGCAPISIRREMQRNAEFRANLAKARSEARMHPLETLRQAAKTSWRAALAWMDRLDPVQFADPTESIVTKREANRFVDVLLASIGQTVKDPNQRRDLFDLLGAAMPVAMRRRWQGNAMHRAVDQMKQDVEERNRREFQKDFHAKAERDRRRVRLFEEIAKYLPQNLQPNLWNQRDLLDPEEVFAQQPKASDSRDPAPANPTKTNNVPLGTNNVPPPGRNADHIVPPPSPNQAPPNNLRTPCGTKSTA
jgi:hypothetical protein